MSLKSLIILVSLFTLFPLSAQAMSCHCFADRDYDPGEPAAADPYYLATAQNSFFSVVFGLKKKKVVLAKQKPGATAEKLWISYWLAATTRQPLQKLSAEGKSSSWLGGLEAAGVDLELFPQGFIELLKGAASDNQLARYVVDDLLVTRGIVTKKQLQILQEAKATDQETILAAILGRKTGRQPADLLSLVRGGETTWGTLLLKAGMNGKEMVKEIGSLLNREGQS